MLYTTSWAQYRTRSSQCTPYAYKPGHIDPFVATHINYAFAIINSTYHVIPYEWNDDQLIAQLNGLKTQNPALKTLISIGGWTFSQSTSTGSIFPTVAAQAGPRATFVASAIAYARRYNFDGIDIDWEYPIASQRASFTLLMQALRSGIEAEVVPAVSALAVAWHA